MFLIAREIIGYDPDVQFVQLVVDPEGFHCWDSFYKPPESIPRRFRDRRYFHG